MTDRVFRMTIFKITLQKVSKIFTKNVELEMRHHDMMELLDRNAESPRSV